MSSYLELFECSRVHQSEECGHRMVRYGICLPDEGYDLLYAKRMIYIRASVLHPMYAVCILVPFSPRLDQSKYKSSRVLHASTFPSPEATPQRLLFPPRGYSILQRLLHSTEATPFYRGYSILQRLPPQFSIFQTLRMVMRECPWPSI